MKNHGQNKNIFQSFDILGYCSEGPDRDRSLSQDSTSLKPKGKRILTNQSTEEGLSWIPEMCGPTIIKESEDCDINEPKSYELTTTIEITTVTSQSDNFLSIPSTTIATSNSLDTLTESTLSGPSSPSNLSSVTLVGSTGSGSFTGMTKNCCFFFFKFSEFRASLPIWMRTSRASLKKARSSKIIGTLSERADSITTETSSTASITTTSTTTISATSESQQYKFGTAPTAPLPERIRPKAKEFDSPKHQTTQSLPPTVTTTHYVEAGGAAVTQESQQKLVDIDEPRPKSRSSSTVSTLQPHKTLMDRRPSAGANIQIPHAALCQHRHSLQLNGDSGLPRVRNLVFKYRRSMSSLIFHFREVVNVRVHDHFIAFKKRRKNHENICSERHKKSPGKMVALLLCRNVANSKVFVSLQKILRK